MHTNPIPSKEYLLSRLSYNQDTGILIWKNGFRIGKIAGSKDIRGYINIRFKKNSPLLGVSRLIFVMMTGDCPEFVDHINGDAKDNRWCNLRPATRSQNNVNIKKSKANKTGFRGVYWDKNCSKYRAGVGFKGKRVDLGLFVNPKEASEAVNALGKMLHGEFWKEW